MYFQPSNSPAGDVASTGAARNPARFRLSKEITPCPSSNTMHFELEPGSRRLVEIRNAALSLNAPMHRCTDALIESM